MSDAALRASCPSCNSLDIRPRIASGQWHCKTCGATHPAPRWRPKMRHRGITKSKAERLAYQREVRERNRAKRPDALIEHKPQHAGSGAVAGRLLIRGYVYD